MTPLTINPQQPPERQEIVREINRQHEAVSEAVKMAAHRQDDRLMCAVAELLSVCAMSLQTALAIYDNLQPEKTP